ncbi:MAG: hypothetical protein PVTTEEND_000213, partial [Candidatus Fervidibacter sp.]
MFIGSGGSGLLSHLSNAWAAREPETNPSLRGVAGQPVAAGKARAAASPGG